MSSVDPLAGTKYAVFNRLTAHLRQHGFSPFNSSGSLYRTRDGGLFDCISLLLDYGQQDANLLCTLNIGIGYLSGHHVPENRKCALTWNIGYLMSGRKWIEWDLSVPGGEETTISELLRSIDFVAIPWLERFETASDVQREQSLNQPRGFGELKRPAKRSWAS